MLQRVIPVHVREGYDVVIGDGLLEDSGRLLRAALGDCRLAVVTDSNVEKLYLSALIFGGACLAAHFRRRRRLAAAGSASVGGVFLGFGLKLATASLG